MKKVLIVTNSSETGIDKVVSELEKLGQSYLLVNVDRLATDNFELFESLNRTEYEFNLKIGDSYIESSNLLSIWYRRPNFGTGNQELSVFDPGLFAASEWKYSFHSLHTILPGYWMNNPIWGVYLLEHNKVRQMQIAAAVGLKTPDTIITNSYQLLSDFCDKHQGIIVCKSIYGAIFCDQDNNRWGIYTQRITKKELNEGKERIGYAPVMAQEYIAKSIELRVTIIGHHVLCCSIYSQDSERTKDDWRRYDFKRVKHEIYVLPEDITEKLKRFMIRCSLNFGAVDMILTPAGEYVFLEVNPSGQYGWIEALTNLPISATIAAALSTPHENGLVWTSPY